MQHTSPAPQPGAPHVSSSGTCEQIAGMHGSQFVHPPAASPVHSHHWCSFELVGQTRQPRSSFETSSPNASMHAVPPARFPGRHPPPPKQYAPGWHSPHGNPQSLRPQMRFVSTHDSGPQAQVPPSPPASPRRLFSPICLSGSQATSRSRSRVVRIMVFTSAEWCDECAVMIRINVLDRRAGDRGARHSQSLEISHRMH